jgi:hypothetical protein
MNPYQLISSSKDKAFQMSANLACNSKNKCKMITNFFRCISLNEYLEINQKAVSLQFVEANQVLLQQECLQNNFITGQSKINLATSDIFSAINKLADQELKKLAKKSPESMQEKILWQGIKFRAEYGLNQLGDAFLPKNPALIKRLPFYVNQKNLEKDRAYNLIELINLEKTNNSIIDQ